MITIGNLKDMLMHIGFTETGKDIYAKQYQHDATITVDFNKKKINYAPVDANFVNGEYPTYEKQASGFIIHRDTTLNFSSNENFVCLVCVHYLLEKGYEPKHIVFEPAFKVGHVNKPSYGDILVFDEKYNPLVLIENKTYGAKFSEEWNKMQKDGGQLFSYLGPLVNELGLCENLVLFAADFDNAELVLKNHIITLKDNENAEIDSSKTFKNSQGKYFEVWSDTYAKPFETKGLFEKDVVPYSIGKLKYTLEDLKSLSHAEIRPIYHEFATILRNHAITDFEHSFYILIDLFLCKITDERRNPNDLQFYYRGITRDTPKKYCARLLKLYQQGKHDLFDIVVVNKDEEDIKQIFEDTSRSLTNGLFTSIKELFEEIKFYNIKKFNFIDVENKEEFEMNFQILIKIAALIQDINLSNSETNHLFGDLFEGLLSRNVHQTEGQFFTPLPIVNFIVKSLPKFPNQSNIKVLDYACGAGHFLTEFIKSYPNVSVYGIEKSQTLSQVAKIATIINGSKDAHIVFKDSLSVFNTRDVRYQGFDDETFDIIIANPPYSVKGFLSTLDDNDRNQYELIKAVNVDSYEKNDAIESFFIERTKHFLRQYGLIGIVLPVSILSNEDTLSKRTRELLFANFNILAIVSLGNRTFGSTGTNTIILFAQKVKKNAEGLVEHFIADDRYEQYTNYQAIDRYVEKQGYDRDAYYAFMQNDNLAECIENHDVFKDYKKAFKPTTIKKSLQIEWFKASSYKKDGIKENSKEYKQLLADFLQSTDYKELEESEIKRQFIVYAKGIEREKLYTFIQIENNNVIILQSPPDKKNDKSNKNEIIKFLGYDWSGRKGDEGIKYITKPTYVEEEDGAVKEDKNDKDVEIVRAINSIRFIDTPLYNPDDDWDNTKFAYALRKHIYEQCKKFSFGTNDNKEKICQSSDGSMSELLSFASLADMLDFTQTRFSKAIKTTPERKIIINSKYPLVRLSDVIDIISGGTPDTNYAEYWNGDIPWLSVADFNKTDRFVYTAEKSITTLGLQKSNTQILQPNDVIISARGTVGALAQIGKPMAFNQSCYGLRGHSEIDNGYLYYCLSEQIEQIRVYATGTKFPSIVRSTFDAIKIPLPPKDVQQKIVDECQKVDEEYNSSRMSIEDYRKKIAQIFEDLQVITRMGGG